MAEASNITKSAIKTLAITDTEDNVIQQMQIKMYDAIKNCGKLGQYGLYGNAPKNSLVIVMQINGQEEVLYGIEDDVNNRPRGIKEGEVMLFNTLTKNYIYLKEDGDTDIYAKQNININVNGDVVINAQNVIVNGTASINGDANVSGNLAVGGTMSAGVVEAGNGADLSASDTVTSVKGIVTGA